MDHIRILKRAFEIVRRYRALWIFGVLLALTGGGGGGSGSGGSSGGSGGGDFNNGPFNWPDGFPPMHIPQGVITGAIGAVIAIVCLIFVLAVVMTIVRYVSDTAAIRMVDRHETSGEMVRFGDGWRMGWSRAAFRLWLVDLLVGLVVFFAIILMFALAAAPLLLWLTSSDVMRTIGTVAAIGLGVLAILITIVVAAGVSLLGEFFHRAVVLENLGVMDAIRRGWQIVRRMPGDAIIMGLIMFGLRLLFSIALIPVVLLVMVASGLTAAIPGVLIGLLVASLASREAGILAGLVVGLPIFCLVLLIPLTFVSGLFEAYKSSVWTLTYRELTALQTVAPTPAPSGDVLPEPPAALE